MKQWYQSKVIWLNVILTVVMIAQVAVGVGLPLAWAVLIGAVGNILVRIWFTKEPIGGSK
jgi:hypothetical protein